MPLFRDDDAGYLDWLKRHPRGFVVSCRRQLDEKLVTLHRATCPTLAVPPPTDGTWTGEYVKVCDTDPDALHLWAEEATGARIRPCRICRPHEPGR